MNEDKQTRRSFLRAIGLDRSLERAPKTVDRDRSETKQQTAAEVAASSDVQHDAVKPAKRQFTLRKLLYVTTLAAIFFATFGEHLRENPLVFIVVLALCTALSLLQELTIRAFDKALWWFFGEEKDRRRR